MLPGDDIYEQVDRCSRRSWVDDEIERASGRFR
jgi:hypothetical protein